MRCGWQVFHWSLITSDSISAAGARLSRQSGVERVGNGGAALENTHVHERLEGLQERDELSSGVPEAGGGGKAEAPEGRLAEGRPHPRRLSAMRCPFCSPSSAAPRARVLFARVLTWTRLILPTPSALKAPGLTFLLPEWRLSLAPPEGSAETHLDAPSTQKPPDPLCSGPPPGPEQNVCPERGKQMRRGQAALRPQRAEPPASQ